MQLYCKVKQNSQERFQGHLKLLKIEKGSETVPDNFLKLCKTLHLHMPIIIQ